MEYFILYFLSIYVSNNNDGMVHQIYNFYVEHFNIWLVSRDYTFFIPSEKIG